MEGESNGGQEAAQDAQGQAQQGRQREDSQGRQEVSGSAPDFEGQISERDARIAELEAQVAEAAKTAEAAEALRGEIAELRAQGESDRIDFKLQLAGCRNVKAARAILDDHGGDVDKLREAEPWLFAKHLAPDGASGTTGLPNAGAATDEGRTLKRWREIAGLSDDGKKEE